MKEAYYRGWLWAVVIAFDQLGNALTGGHPDVTISARIGRGYCDQLRPRWWWAAMRASVDWGFSPVETDHCAGAYRTHVEFDIEDKIQRGNDAMLVLLSLVLLVFVPVLGCAFRVYKRVSRR